MDTDRLEDALALMEAAVAKDPRRPHRTIEGAAGLRMGREVLDKCIATERLARDVLREVRRTNRSIFGWFRWRYHLDRLFARLQGATKQ